MPDHRILRSRILDLDGSLDSGHSPPSEGTPALIVRVFDAGSMPSSNDHYFACHPVEIDGDASEGAVGTPVVDTSSTVIVDVIGNRATQAGDYLRAFYIGGRWVAENNGGSCPVKVCVTCGTAESPAVVGATVSLRLASDHSVVASGTTGSDGCADIVVREAGDYEVRIAATGHPVTNVVKTVACGGTLDFDLCGICLGGLCDLPAEDLTLTVSTDNGDPIVLTLTYNAPTGGEVNGQYVNFYQGTITFRLLCTDPNGWQLQVTFPDSTNGNASTTCSLIMIGDCDGPSLEAIDADPCPTLQVSTHFTLPVTISL